MAQTLKHPVQRFFTSTLGVIIAGILIGGIAVWLQEQGNPPNMGVCIACFLRDIAGAIGLHHEAKVQYLRPEIPGIVFGALISALLFREFRSRGGSAPLLRFCLGFFAMVGALVFLGCTWRMLLRLAGSDGNALIGFVGLLAGIGIGVLSLRAGYTLGRSKPIPPILGVLLPIAMGVLLVLLLLTLSGQLNGVLAFSKEGPGSKHAPLLFSLLGGLVIGFLAQRSRFCTVGAFRDAILVRSGHLFWGVVAFFLSALLMNVLLGGMRLPAFGFAGMPIAHSNALWNFLGLLLAGLAFTLAGGCPGRQVVLSGEGDSDAALFVLGMLGGATFMHNFAAASKPDAMVAGALQVGGPGLNGMIAVGVGVVFCIILGLTARPRAKATVPVAETVILPEK